MPNWVDIIIVLVLALFVWNGYYKGFIRQFGDLALLVLSIFITFSLYVPLSIFLSNNFHISFLTGIVAKIAALVILWVTTQIIFLFLWRVFYHQFPEGVRESRINKWAGAAPGLLWGILFTIVVFILGVVILGFLPGYSGYRDAITDSASGKIIVSQQKWFTDKVLGNLGGAFSGTVSFRTVEPNSNETYQLGFKTTNVKVDSTSENQMLELVNKERQARGLKALVMDEKLTSVAEAHSRDMFAKGYFAHKSPDGKDPFKRMNDAGVIYLVAGENLALAPDVKQAHSGLMNSPGHRANILAPEYGKVGIGVLDGGQYGMMFAQEFTNW